MALRDKRTIRVVEGTCNPRSIIATNSNLRLSEAIVILLISYRRLQSWSRLLSSPTVWARWRACPRWQPNRATWPLRSNFIILSSVIIVLFTNHRSCHVQTNFSPVSLARSGPWAQLVRLLWIKTHCLRCPDYKHTLVSILLIRRLTSAQRKTIEGTFEMLDQFFNW